MYIYFLKNCFRLHTHAYIQNMNLKETKYNFHIFPLWFPKWWIKIFVDACCKLTDYPFQLTHILSREDNCYKKLTGDHAAVCTEILTNFRNMDTGFLIMKKNPVILTLHKPTTKVLNNPNTSPHFLSDFDTSAICLLNLWN